MRRRDEAVIYPLPVCASGCGKGWETWCRGCNLVFCGDHVAREKHNCANRDHNPPAAAKLEKKTKKAPAPKAAHAASPSPEGQDLFGKPAPNGVASLPSAH